MGYPPQGQAVGKNKLSELEIDSDKSWLGKEITSIKGLASGMAHGDINYRGASVLEKLIANAGKGYSFLRSRGPGLSPEWYDIEDLISYMCGALNRAIYVDTLVTAPSIAEIVTAASIGGWMANPLLPVPLSQLTMLAQPDSIGGWDATPTLNVPAAITDRDMMLVYENYKSGEDGQGNIYGNNWEAQTFTPLAAHNITKLYLKICRTGNPGIITAGIRATDAGNKPTGSDLTSGTIDSSTLPAGTSIWVRITLTSLALSASTRYAIVVRTAGGDINNYLIWRADVTSPSYTRGARCYSTNGGSTWTEDTAADYMFEEGS
jgi:hypothetical protein